MFSVFWVFGCSTASLNFDRKAKGLGFYSVKIQGLNFTHIVYANNNSNDKEELHVYLGGDGSPWFKGRYITDDPTPLNPVMLNLMKMDNAPSIFLGRPCYHQFKMPSNCKKSLWTNQRYSLDIVKSMVAAVKSYTRKNNYSKVKLFGFSGGGALAMLMAGRLQNVTTVVTLAGNLNTDAWVEFHRYLPLIGSLNPSKEPPLRSNIQQVHLVGLMDENIPMTIIEAEVSRQGKATLMLVKDANHYCCWGVIWRQVLMQL